MNKVMTIIMIVLTLTLTACDKGAPIIPALKPLCDAIGVGCW